MKQALTFSLLLIAACTVEENLEFACAENNDDLNLPAGFCAVVVADSLGRARHLTVRDNGDIYVAFRNQDDAGGIAALRDENGNGRADRIEYFGDLRGTGIHWREGWIYFGANNQIVRYALNAQEFTPASAPEVMVNGFQEQNSHQAKPFEFDDSGNLYVNIGAPSNACQEMRRSPGSEGLDPCPQLNYFGGVWRVSIRPEQHVHEDGIRYATGIRHGVANAWHEGNLYVVQHGRDDLHRLWPDLFTETQNNNLPAEEFLVVQEGADFGWPYCYYDHQSGIKKLNPEYGGDGEIIGRCEQATLPIHGFPAHWAPNDLLFYTGTQYPEKYHNGAFVAFHGSWNRSPIQDGFQVIFLPMAAGEVLGEPEMFAGGFAAIDSLSTPGLARARPTGLAMGPDGSVYISDSVKGRIWRILYTNSSG
ncbi:MAG: PQQ-dependent sugar dehydrogenase [Bacteroidetes bacterium]|nr:PQQ-dependent sugar dehydrogenase [Bacteroidota bacterium]MCY4205733.1 PQQ-dependent sugar dehydrogenase [Bacteroidota bacterium]